MKDLALDTVAAMYCGFNLADHECVTIATKGLRTSLYGSHTLSTAPKSFTLLVLAGWKTSL
jgi:hypothetical protein